MKSMPKLVSVVLLVRSSLASPVVFLKGCGDNKTTNISAPSTSVLIINPSLTKYTVGGVTGVCPDPNASNTETHTITLYDKPVDDGGVPMDNVAVTIELDFAPGTASPALQCRALVDRLTGLPVTSPWTTKTDEYGTINVGVRTDFGFEFAGSLRAYSGQAFASAANSVEVK